MSANLPWPRLVRGLSVKSIHARFPDAPEALTEKWCMTNLWWWRVLADGKIPAQIPPSWTWLLQWLERRGAMEEWLRRCENNEWLARVRGASLPEPEHPTSWVNLHRETQPYTLAAVQVTDLHTKADVIDMVLSHLRDQGWKPGKGLFKRDRNTAGRRNWYKIFSAVELVDRYTLLDDALDRDSSREHFAKDPNRMISARYRRRVSS